MYERINLVELLSITTPTMSDDFKEAISSPKTSCQEKLMLALLSQCSGYLNTMGLASGIYVCPFGSEFRFEAHRREAGSQ
ncbi:hypothetical protein DVB73_07530 [Pseudomonas plecoglossicida]|uniref:Uncharacterized protein n=1 Tax=Pseudomonas plecoglossicida TaxID=70775 RepID=A0AAD0R0A8_PSEDL|nr:hypothetical protein DVB73_07530 [Pseudomonas plecoglossicida]EPB94474.1 hypothetical protein L321_19062 [Pseudomonas plecoglossicida NB2011]